jgi:hypothetical protein
MQLTRVRLARYVHSDIISDQVPAGHGLLLGSSQLDNGEGLRRGEEHPHPCRRFSSEHLKTIGRNTLRSVRRD